MENKVVIVIKHSKIYQILALNNPWTAEPNLHKSALFFNKQCWFCIDQSFSNFWLDLLVVRNLLSIPPQMNQLNIKLQNLPNLPMFNIIYSRKESVNYKCKLTFNY